jgi:hypothetical protein
VKNSVSQRIKQKGNKEGNKSTYLKTSTKDSNIKQTIMHMHRVYSKLTRKHIVLFPCQPTPCRHRCRISFCCLYLLFKTDSLSTILCLTHVTSAILFPASFVHKLHKSKYEKHVDKTQSPRLPNHMHMGAYVVAPFTGSKVCSFAKIM